MALTWGRSIDQFGNTTWVATATTRKDFDRPMTWKIIPVVLGDRLRWSLHDSSSGLLREIPPGGSGDGFEDPDAAKSFCEYREAIAPVA